MLDGIITIYSHIFELYWRWALCRLLLRPGCSHTRSPGADSPPHEAADVPPGRPPHPRPRPRPPEVQAGAGEAALTSAPPPRPQLLLLVTS